MVPEAIPLFPSLPHPGLLPFSEAAGMPGLHGVTKMGAGATLPSADTLHTPHPAPLRLIPICPSFYLWDFTVTNQRSLGPHMGVKSPYAPSVMTPSPHYTPNRVEWGHGPPYKGEVNGFIHSQNIQNTPTPRTSETRISTGQNPHRYKKTKGWGHLYI